MTDAPHPEPPTPDDSVDAGRSDEDRDISDVGLPHPGDDTGPDPAVDEAALDEVFPPEHR